MLFVLRCDFFCVTTNVLHSVTTPPQCESLSNLQQANVDIK